ncbi:MAG: YbbR-like domain-containing protein [Alphaproteobacteria bacterium]
MKQLWEQITLLSRSNLGLKVLALIIALGLWLAGHRDTERAIEVPVEFRNIPSDLMVSDNRVDYVVLRLMGPRTLISTLDSEDLKLSMDLKGAKSGSASYPLGAHSFSVPRGVTIARITPPVIHLRLEPVLKRAVPVAVRLSSGPPAGYKVYQTTVQPPAVSVQGPADDVKRLTAVETVPIDIEETNGVVMRKVRLSADGKALSFSPDQVEVAISVDEEETTRDFERVEIQAKGFGGVYTVNPRSVFLRLSGPRQALNTFVLGPDQVYLNLTGLKVGEHAVPLVFNLPPKFSVVEQKPKRVKVRITKAGA